MGIFREGVRVTRALTPTPSSSSSDDEEPRLKKKCIARKIIEKAPSLTKDSSDLFQVRNSTCQLPEELFELSNLGDVLSLQSWNDRLSEKERQQLCAYFPLMDEGSFQETLKELFSGQNMCFGSPLEDLWQQLKGGLCNPDVVRSRQTLISLHRREYYHDLRRYHNGMVNSLMQMRELWASDPEANIEEKLSTWHTWRSSEAVCMDGLKASEDRVEFESRYRAAGVVDNGVIRVKNSIHTSDAELILHSDVELDQVLKCNNVHSRALIVESVQGQVNADRPETSYNGKLDLSFRDGALKEGSNLKRKSTSQEDFEQRCKQSKHMKGNGNVPRAPICCEYEDAHLLKRQHDGHRDLGFKASEMMVKELHSKLCNKVMDKQVLSSYQQDRVQSCVTKPLRSIDFNYVPPLTPGFTFSTLHFLSAVRASLVDNVMPDGVECLPFREIVRRVEACPGDRRVLELQMPLYCLVRGALKVLASTSKELSTDCCKPLVAYDKAMRYWSWVGLVPGLLNTFKEVDLQAVSKVWSISSSSLNELQDMFGKWLKNTQRTLQQLWQLAQIPMPAYPVFPDEKERFRELRAQKSFTTVLPSTYEMRALFRNEEQVRYSVLEIAFRYTTADGQKSAVAPLRKLGGKSKAKARDHYLLRSDRPSHITILCLVRDAAARLPQGIGTRADVCILLRDSQFIQDVSELQLSQVVSGALDRLHYEKDPCVRYDQDKKLWLYLHGGREEEDFEEGGTSSTRSSRRSKKDGSCTTVSPAQGHGFNDDMSEPEPDSGPLNGYEGAREAASPEFLYDNYQNGRPPALVPGAVGGQMRDDVLLPFMNLSSSMQPFCGDTMQGHPMGWEVYRGGKELSITH